MDEYMLHNEDYRVLICIQCGYGCGHIKRHMADFHRKWPLQVRKAISQYASQLDLAKPNSVVPPSLCAPIAGLIVRDGFSCPLCKYSAASDRTVDEHRKTKHKTIRADAFHPRRVKVQTFFVGPYRRFFEVQSENGDMPSKVLCNREQSNAISYQSANLGSAVEEQLSRKVQERAEFRSGLQAVTHPTLVSPWLEMTRWPTYLRGQDLMEASLLVQLPPIRPPGENNTDGVLLTIFAALDRIIECAKTSISEDKINAFDQYRINSFIKRRSYWYLISAKLQEGTYKKYKLV